MLAETLGATPPEAFGVSSEHASVGVHSSGAPGAGHRLRASGTESAGNESDTTAPVAAAALALSA